VKLKHFSGCSCLQCLYFIRFFPLGECFLSLENCFWLSSVLLHDISVLAVENSTYGCVATFHLLACSYVVHHLTDAVNRLGFKMIIF